MKIKIMAAAFAVFTSLTTIAQGYGNLGYSLNYSDKTAYHGFAFGAGGIVDEKYGIGFNADFILGSFKYAIAAADLRYYYNQFYLSLQPGYILYDKTINHVKTRGSFSGTALIGYTWKMLNVSAGYQNNSFKTLGEVSRSGGLKLNIGIVFN